MKHEQPASIRYKVVVFVLATIFAILFALVVHIIDQHARENTPRCNCPCNIQER